MAMSTSTCSCLFVALTLAYSASTPTATRAGARKDKKVFATRTEVMSLHLAEAHFGLAYEESEMGPSTDWAPGAVAFSVKRGLYLVDPGPPSAPQPSLQHFSRDWQRFSRDLRRVYCTPLVHSLGLAEPATFVAHRLSIDDNGGLSLFYSRSYDAGEKDFAIAHFDPSGVLIENAAVEGVAAGSVSQEYVLMGPAHAFWVHDPTGSQRYWKAYDSSGKQGPKVPGDSDALVLRDGRLLAIAHGGAARLYDSTLRESPVEVHGTISNDDQGMIGGAGNFFGAISLMGQRNTETKSEFTTQMFYDIDILYHSHSRGGDVVTVLGKGSIALDPEKSQLDGGAISAEKTRPSWMQFDANGDLYVISRRSPKHPAIVVSRFTLLPEVHQRLVHELDKTNGPAPTTAKPPDAQ